MYYKYRVDIFEKYNTAYQYFAKYCDKLILLENYIHKIVSDTIQSNIEEFTSDYNHANYLQPFWGNYPPEDRGRMPIGDQIPWIEVGEHSIGHKLTRLLSISYSIREVSLPSGSDDRYIISHPKIKEITGYTDSVMVFIDVKSVGPRDDAEHIVVSPYQVSGDGIWKTVNENLVNSAMKALGNRTSHDFYPAVSPIYVLKNGIVCPTIHIFIKPIYCMLSQYNSMLHGQPLQKIKIISLPNGLLLTKNPNYLSAYPNLLFPGKDDKNKSIKKLRCRVSFDIIRKIDLWRLSVIAAENELL